MGGLASLLEHSSAAPGMVWLDVVEGSRFSLDAEERLLMPVLVGNTVCLVTSPDVMMRLWLNGEPMFR